MLKGVYKNLLKCVLHSRSNRNLKVLVFKEKGKPEYPEKNLLEQGREQKKLNPHMVSTPGFEPGPHWWEASALTNAPPLLPKTRNKAITSNGYSSAIAKHVTSTGTILAL